MAQLRPYAFLALVVAVAGGGCQGRDERALRAPGVASGPGGSASGPGSGSAALPPDAAPPDAPERAAEVIPETAPARRVFTTKLEDAAAFDAYSVVVGNERFAKFVVDLKTDAVYYFDVGVYPVHKDFVFRELYKRPKTKQAVRAFDRNYGRSKPEFLLCYLVHHLQQDAWTFAFWDGDLATGDHVRLAYKRLVATFHLGDAVKFRPDSNAQEQVAKALGDVPFVLNDQLYRQADYHAFNKGVAVGTLRIPGPEIAEADLAFAPDDIVVLARPLSDITPVAGIIAEQFSSPLAHVSLRARGWGIPNVGLRGAVAKLAPLAGKPVYFEARDADFVLRAATDAEVAAARARRDARPVVALPVPDLEQRALRPIPELTAADLRTVGGKAANLGVIAASGLTGFEIPAGFGVPFAWSAAHLRAAGIDRQLAALIADPAVARDPALRKRKLAAIRAAIIAAPLDPALCTAVETALAALPPGGGVFVRSSHNAEDLENFSGAGLHDSLPNVARGPAVCEALRPVWASAWKLTAYDARTAAGIDQATVAAGALVQVGIEATAAGVLATVHPTDPTDERQYTINAKAGLGMAVVDGRKTPESLLVSWYNHGIRVLSRSDEPTRLVFDAAGGVREVPNPRRGQPVLTNRMAIRLADTARALTKLFRQPKLDIEWVYAGDTLYIVQTRPLVGS